MRVAVVFITIALAFLLRMKLAEAAPATGICGNGVKYAAALFGSNTDCYNTYINSRANSSFNISFNDCANFASLQGINEANLESALYNCFHHDTNSPLNTFVSGTVTNTHVIASHCVKYDNENCSCEMNCLLTFLFGPKSYVFIESISCNISIFDTAINNTFTLNSDLQTMYNWKEGFPLCIDDDIMTSSTSLLPVTSFHLPSIMSTITETEIFNPTPTNEPMMCSNYDINFLSGTSKYCNNSCFSNLLNESCIENSSYMYNSFQIELSSDQLNITQCLLQDNHNYTLLREVFTSIQQPIDQKLWTLTDISCQCCPHSSYTNNGTCVLKFTNSNQTLVTILFTGLTEAKKNYLRENFVKAINCCSTPTVIMSTSLLPTGSPTSDDPKFHEQLYFQIGAGVLGGCVVIFVLALLVICLVIGVKRRHRQPNKCAVSAVNENAQSPTLASPVPDYDVTQQPMKTLENKHTVLHSLYFDYSKWKQIFSQYIVDQKNVAILETIGEGAFGLVQKGSLTNSRGHSIPVAIKAMKDASTSEQVEEFMSESAIMLDFDHPNVLKLLGVCFDTNDQLPVIILPYMANGDLKSYLQSKRHNTERGTLPDGLSILLLVRMCLDIGNGMEYLARKKFVHRDLAARNCMVDEELIVRVADFGLSRDIYSRDYYRLERRVKLPVKWLPPESLNDNIFNEKTDVWSFGVTCWEIFSLGKTPYPAIDNAEVLDYIEKGLRLRKPGLCPKEMYLLLSQCWDESPDVRPSFISLIETMNTIYKNWAEHTNTLRKRMEEELLQSSFEGQEETETTSTVDLTSSMAAHAGSRCITPTKRSSRPSISSLIKNSSNNIESSDEYSRLVHTGSTSVPPSISPSSVKRMSIEQPMSPTSLFETLYDTSQQSCDTSNVDRPVSTSCSINVSIEEPPKVRMPADYTLPIHQKPSIANKSRQRSQSSTTPLLHSVSTASNKSYNRSYSVTNQQPTATDGPFYFTLDPGEHHSVFDSDTSSDGPTQGDTTKVHSSSTSPVLTYHVNKLKETSFTEQAGDVNVSGHIVTENLMSSQQPLHHYCVIDKDIAS